MEEILPIYVLIPFFGFLLSLLMPAKKEGWISKTAFITVGVHFNLALLFCIYWIYSGMPTLSIKELVLYSSPGYEFFLDLYFDEVTAVYLMVGSLLSFLITVYSRYYMHRESGYKRFFNTILFFYTGYTATIFAGNLETLFIGWEILGISSFLLIAFYRNRYLPVKNAVKVFSIYRIGDIGLILAMWMSHHLWHENITFLKLHNYDLVHEQLAAHSWIGIFISLMILVAAAAKSAQLPFSSWLPRAMEGPTPSSAIFYSSLSVHIGVFLLLRTYPFWEQQTSVRVIIILVGLATSLLAAPTARVQSSIKAQIAYSSIAQIGLIFIEVALGFHTLALIHFAGNAFLRTYQLLVSPSAVTYLIREQFYNYQPRTKALEDSFPRRIEYTLYLLSLKEWNLDTFMYRYLWNPLKRAGKWFDFLNPPIAIGFFLITTAVGYFLLQNESFLSPGVFHKIPVVVAFIGFLMVLKAFTERKSTVLSWTLVILNHFWIALAVSFNAHFTPDHTVIYLAGVVASGLVGYGCLLYLKNREPIGLDRFYGHAYEYPVLAFIFLMACLGLAGFPITPTFLGEDLIFTHIHEEQWGLAALVSMSLIVDGLALIRLYSRVFMGPHVKSYHEIAHRSA